jgi:hypothetical protein
MKTEFLKELGLTEEQVTAIMAENGKDIQREKDKASKAELERDGYKEQLDTAQTALKEFEGVDIKELQGKVSELTNNLSEKDAEFQKKLSDMEYTKEIDNYFTGYKFTSDLAKKAAVEEFKKQEFKLVEGKFMGGDDYMKTLKESNPTAFESDTTDAKPPVIVKPTQTRKPGEKMSLAEAMAYKNAHPEVDIKTLI